MSHWILAVQLTLEQHGFELHGFTRMQIFSIVNTIILRIWLNQWIWNQRNDGCGGPTVRYVQIFDCEESWHP